MEDGITSGFILAWAKWVVGRTVFVFNEKWPNVGVMGLSSVAEPASFDQTVRCTGVGWCMTRCFRSR